MVKFHNLPENIKKQFSVKSLEVIDNWSTETFTSNFIRSVKTVNND